MEGLIKFGQRQHFGPLHEIEAGCSRLYACILRHNSGPRMDGH
jgi:hypothetical protein